MGQCTRGGAGAVVKASSAVARVTIGSAICLAVTGCAGQLQPTLTPIEVKVPIALPVYCKVAKPDQPALPISSLSVDSPPADTIRAYAATVAILKGAVRQRDSIIEGCAEGSATEQAQAPPAEDPSPLEPNP